MSYYGNDNGQNNQKMLFSFPVYENLKHMKEKKDYKIAFILYEGLLAELKKMGRDLPDLKKFGKGDFLVSWGTMSALKRGDLSVLRPKTISEISKILNLGILISEETKYYQ